MIIKFYNLSNLSNPINFNIFITSSFFITFFYPNLYIYINIYQKTLFTKFF